MEKKHEDPMMYRSIAAKKLKAELRAWSEAVGIEEPTEYMKGKLDTLLWANKAYDFRIKEDEWKN